MKYRTTEKEQKENASCILGFGYCQIQYIEGFLQPESYTAGVYGWKADFYRITNNVVISTGYSPVDYCGRHERKKTEELKNKILALNDKIKNNKIKLPASYQKKQEKIKKELEKIVLNSLWED